MAISSFLYLIPFLSYTELSSLDPYHHLWLRTLTTISSRDSSHTQDFAHHGGGRLINAYIALVETDPDADEDEEDKTMLKYVASTANDQSIVMGRTLYANQKCIR